MFIVVAVYALWVEDGPSALSAFVVLAELSRFTNRQILHAIDFIYELEVVESLVCISFDQINHALFDT